MLFREAQAWHGRVGHHRLRRQARPGKAAAQGAATDEERPGVSQLPAHTLGVVTRAVNKDLNSAVGRCLEVLTDDKRDVLVAMAAARGLQVHGSEAGLYLWLEVPAACEHDVAYAELCRAERFVVAPGSFFGKGQERFVRLALVPTLEQCHQAAARWPEL